MQMKKIEFCGAFFFTAKAKKAEKKGSFVKKNEQLANFDILRRCGRRGITSPPPPSFIFLQKEARDYFS